MIPLFEEYASVAQLDRARGFEPRGRGFEPLRSHHKSTTISGAFLFPGILTFLEKFDSFHSSFLLIST